jgi:hypothetical protein
VSSLASELKSSADPVSSYLQAQLSPETRQALVTYQSSSTNQTSMETLLIQDLNKIIAGPLIYDTNRFVGITLRSDEKTLLKKQKLRQYDLLCLNRFLLEDAYPKEISRNHQQPPIVLHGFRVCSGIVVGILFAICTFLLIIYPLNKRTTIQMADELAERRRKHAEENPATA